MMIGLVLYTRQNSDLLSSQLLSHPDSPCFILQELKEKCRESAGKTDHHRGVSLMFSIRLPVELNQYQSIYWPVGGDTYVKIKSTSNESMSKLRFLMLLFLFKLA
ncbi:hypothetical protein CRENBAI_000833 [Crenichthys baileyi]|uniref:Uncharacterized protein n=1 Tax=Crenichthys baileyi TaxID=28760 RepID=A0AAV9S8M3_9TELE